MWQLMPGQSFRLHSFDDEFVLYNDLSGDTHLLGAAAVHLLSVLQQGGPASDAALCDALAAALECARDPGFDAQAAAVLAQLASYSLIRRA